MEYADSGDMYQRICQFKQKGHFMSEKFIWKVIVQVASGLKTLHDMQIMHRDLKSANLFVHRSGLVKLGDMNVSKVLKAGMRYTQTGTPYYASPEVWRDEPYDFKSDMWSLGCVIYEIAALSPPFQAIDMNGLYKSIMKGKYNRLPRVFSRDLNALIGMLLHQNPRDRPTCSQLLSIPFVQVRAGCSMNPMSFVAETSLLNTIYLPKNLFQLPEILPEPNYTDRSERSSLLHSDVSTVRTRRDISSKSVLKARPNRTPTPLVSSRDYSESPGLAHMKVLRENYGAFKLPPMKYPDGRYPSKKKSQPSVFKRISSRAERNVKPLREVRHSVIQRGESQLW